ncbi:MAG: LptA/OstA family protein [Caulobacteraceae bacterium]
MLKRKDIGRGRRLAGGGALAALCAGSGLAAWAVQPADVRFAASPLRDTAALTKIAVAAADRTQSPRAAQPTSSTRDLAAPTIEKLAPTTSDGAKNNGGAAEPQGPITERPAPDHGPISITADTLNKYGDERRVAYAGNVEVTFDGSRLVSDALDLYFDKPAGARACAGRGQGRVRRTSHGRSPGPCLLRRGDRTAQADQASYDPKANTITLSGNAVVQSGQTVVKGEKLILQVKDGVATQPGQTGPSTENAIRRWIAAVQMHEIDEADMSPALIQAGAPAAGDGGADLPRFRIAAERPLRAGHAGRRWRLRGKLRAPENSRCWRGR